MAIAVATTLFGVTSGAALVTGSVDVVTEEYSGAVPDCKAGAVTNGNNVEVSPDTSTSKHITFIL